MWRVLSRYRMVLAIILMTLALFGKATGAYAETVDPTPTPTVSEPTPEPTEPTPEPTEPTPLPQLCQGLADPEPVGPGDPTTECVVKIDDQQFGIIQLGLGVLVLFGAVHVIGSWRGGRDG